MQKDNEKTRRKRERLCMERDEGWLIRSLKNSEHHKVMD
jgi:hypothetical protein